MNLAHVADILSALESIELAITRHTILATCPCFARGQLCAVCRDIRLKLKDQVERVTR